jgi:hypothetical protein
VTQEQLAEQQRRNAAKYLALPPSLQSSVHTVHDVRTLVSAARSLGVPLDWDLHPPAREDPRATALLSPLAPQRLLDFVPPPASETPATGPARAGLVSQALAHRYRAVVGLDAEWKTEMYKNLDYPGASILQVTWHPAHKQWNLTHTEQKCPVPRSCR